MQEVANSGFNNNLSSDYVYKAEEKPKNKKKYTKIQKEKGFNIVVEYYIP